MRGVEVQTELADPLLVLGVQLLQRESRETYIFFESKTLGELIQTFEEAQQLPDFEDFEFLLQVLTILKNQRNVISQVLLKSNNIIALHVLDDAVQDVQVIEDVRLQGLQNFSV